MEANNEMQVLIEKIKKKSTFMKWGIGLAGVLLLAPLVWALAYAILGAAFLGLSLTIAGAVGMAIIYYTPVFMMKLQNAKINAIIAEAQKNPIPTLWSEFDKDTGEVDEMEQAIGEYGTEIENVKSKRDKLASKLTAKDLEAFDGDIATMEEDFQLQQTELAELRTGLDKQKVEIERASAIWDLGMAMNKANAKNLAAQRESTLSRIKKETALDSVTASMNRGKVQLRMRIQSRRRVAEGDGVQRIALSPTESLEILENVKVKAAR